MASRGGILKHSSAGPRIFSAADVAEIAQLAIDKLTSAESSVVDKVDLDRLARFRPDSFGIGRLIGEGTFCNVHEIGGDGGEAARNYVVKILKPARKAEPECYEKAIMDLAREVCFLSSMKHPNIIQIHGSYLGSFSAVSVANCEAANACFVVLERLRGTLEQRVVAWRKQEHRGRRNLLRDAKKDRAHLVERLKDARQIATVMSYLHANRVIYRDLKPANIGYDLYSGRVKIFDFGLARELPDDVKYLQDTFQMSGHADSNRYLAPECIKCQPYNQTADAYSFGILLWELCTLQQAYEGYGKYDMHYSVACGNHRPEMCDSLPFPIRNLISVCWSDDMNMRPYFDTIDCVLGGIITDLEETVNKALLDKKGKRLISKLRSFHRNKHEKPKRTAAPGA